MADTPGDMLHMRQMAGFTTELYIPWSELSWRKLLSTLATARYSCPNNAIRLVAQCELSRYVKLVIWRQLGRNFHTDLATLHSWNSKTAICWRHCGLLATPFLSPVSLISMGNTHAVMYDCCANVI